MLVFWIFYNVPEFVGFQTMIILDHYGMTFDAVGVFGLAFHLLFRSWSTYWVIFNYIFQLMRAYDVSWASLKISNENLPISSILFWETLKTLF